MTTATQRVLPSLRLQEGPLLLVLFQVRFSTILKMESFLPDIQERLRSAYPIFSESVVQEVLFPALGDEVAARRSKRWIFASADESSAVVITPDFVAVETSAYTVFDDFVDTVCQVMAVVQEVADIQYATRIGLRYIDRIVPKASETLSQYLTPGLLGMPAISLSEDSLGLSVRPTLTLTRVHVQTQSGSTLMIRMAERGPDDTSLPPGIEDQDIQLRIDPVSRHTAFLDIDHFATARLHLEADALHRAAWDLHEYASLAFRRCITTHALSVWQGGV